MGWFSKRQPTLVPGEVLSQLAPFGRAVWGSKVGGGPITDARFDWPSFFSKASLAHQAKPAQAIAEIHAAAGDDPFAKIGGYGLISEFEPASKDARYLAMMDAYLDMMYERGLSSGHMNRYEAQRWVETHGDLRTSFDRIVEVTPPEHQTPSVSLELGEPLIVAKMGPGVLDNEFWIERTSQRTMYVAFSMRQQNSDATALTRYEEESIGEFDDAAGILRSVGDYLRLRPYWAHEQLAPYFPERRDL